MCLTRRKKNKLKDVYRVFMGPVCLLSIVWLGGRRGRGRPRPRRHRSHRPRRVPELPPAPQLGVACGAPVVRPDQVVEVEVPRGGGQVGGHHPQLLLWQRRPNVGAGLCVVSCYCSPLPHTAAHTFSLHFDCIDFLYFHWLLFLLFFCRSFWVVFSFCWLGQNQQDVT